MSNDKSALPDAHGPDLPDTFCCGGLESMASMNCEEHTPAWCPDYAVRWYIDGEHYGIPIDPAAGGGCYGIRYCPWCGEQLPYPEASE